MTGPIPQCSPRANYLAHKNVIDAAVDRVLDSGHYILGPEVAAFERDFAAWLGLPHAFGVANGTDALHVALRAVGVSPGDEVVTVSHTAVATVAAIELCGAVPVLVDVDRERMTMDPRAFATAITPRTKAVIPVHLYGQAADVAPIVETARAKGIAIVEDCAQSHGARLDGRRLATFGDVAAFSFYPTKNLGALGDGGAVATSRADVAERVRLLRQYGWKERYVSAIPGFNSRLDEIQAAILRAKLPSLDAENARRRERAADYRRLLAGASGITLPAEVAGVEHVYHQFVVQANDRQRLQERLAKEQIATAVHYPVPVHLQPAYAGRIKTPGGMAVTEALAKTVLSLPMFPELAKHDAVRVAEAIGKSA